MVAVMLLKTWANPPPCRDPREWDLRPRTFLGVEETGPRGSGGTRIGINEQSVCFYLLRDSA